jgi:hypothetical protein
LGGDLVISEKRGVILFRHGPAGVPVGPDQFGDLPMRLLSQVLAFVAAGAISTITLGAAIA